MTIVHRRDVSQRPGPRDTLRMRRFNDKIAIVTGAGSGIGRATARRLAAEGAAVTIADIDEAGAGATVELIRTDGGTARAQATDVAEPEAVERMVADTVAAYGGLDLLHNNAAAIQLNLTDQDVVTMPLETWHMAMRVNLDGVMLGCRFAIPAMLERGGGAVVNTASVAATYGSKSLAAYGTSKAGVVALTRYVATAYADRNIRVNAGRARRRRRPRPSRSARRPTRRHPRADLRRASRRPTRLPRRDRHGRRLFAVRRSRVRHRPDVHN